VSINNYKESFFFELLGLTFLFIPCAVQTKKRIIQSLNPLFSKLQFVGWTIGAFTVFVFASTLYEANQSMRKLSSDTVSDLTRQLVGAEAQRDAMLSFVSLLLLPVIRAHNNLMFECFMLEKTKEALLKQAKSASDYAQSLMNAKDNDKDKDKMSKKKGERKENEEKENENKNKNDELESKKIKELENQLEDLQTRLNLSNQSRDEFKEKLSSAEKEIQSLRENDPSSSKKDR